MSEHAESDVDLDQLVSQWLTQTISLDVPMPKNRPGEELGVLVNMLRDQYTDSGRDRLLELAASRTDESDVYAVVGALAILYRNSGDRPRLVAVLAKACPPQVLRRDVEDYIVCPRQDDRMADPVTVFFDAYRSSTSAESKGIIAKALRRGFAFVGDQPEHDDELVTWCEAWYAEHRQSIVFNVDYSYNQDSSDYRVNGLFVRNGE